MTTKQGAGRLGGLTTASRYGRAHYQALGRLRAGMNVLGDTPEARRLWSLRLNSLRGKSPDERKRLVAKWRSEAAVGSEIAV